MPVLLQAEGNDWRIEVIGKIPDIPPFITILPQTAVIVEGFASLEVFDRTDHKMHRINSNASINPIFFESVLYDIHLEKMDPDVEINLPLGSEIRRKRPESEHYIINFGNNVGFFDILIKNKTEIIKLKLEVFSRKMDYRTDYITMRDDISSMLRNLAMAANARTYGLAAPSKDHNPTIIEWWSLIERYFEDFIKIANAIGCKPHCVLIKKDTLVVADKARRISRQSISRALRKGNAGGVVSDLNFVPPKKIHEKNSTVTFNSPENRYYKALVNETLLKIRTLLKSNNSGDEDANLSSEVRFLESVRPQLKNMERKVQAVLRSPFLTQVNDVEFKRPNSMIIHKHPLYSRFDKLCRILNGGLSFSNNLLPIGIKETSLLYEYWCFLKIVGLLRNKFDLVEQDVVAFKKLKMTVTLKKGKQSAIKFLHAPSGTEMFLIYNKLFNKLPTLAQQPDNVIQFASAERFYIFDAKYRIQFDKEYINFYGGPGPTTDDINTMHRYRDAIAIPHPLKSGLWKKGSVIGALTLFPYPDENTYRSHKFYKSINHVEIGGIPFMPNATDLMNEKLNDILKKEFPVFFTDKNN